MLGDKEVDEEKEDKMDDLTKEEYEDECDDDSKNSEAVPTLLRSHGCLSLEDELLFNEDDREPSVIAAKKIE